MRKTENCFTYKFIQKKFSTRKIFSSEQIALVLSKKNSKILASNSD